MNRVFDDKNEYSLVSKLLEAPFVDEVQKRKKAAWKSRGGDRTYLKQTPREDIECIYVNYIRNRPDLNVTAIAYKGGEPTKHACFTINKLTWKNISTHLSALFT